MTVSACTVGARSLLVDGVRRFTPPCDQPATHQARSGTDAPWEPRCAQHANDLDPILFDIQPLNPVP